MVARSVRVGGFGLTVEVPENLPKVIVKVTGGRGLHRRRQPIEPGASRLVLRDPPEATYERRDPEAGLAFIRHRVEQRASAPDDGPPGDNEEPWLARRVAAHPWYHTIELPNGVVTNGYYDHRELVPSYGIPPDLQGKRVLDVGSADGFWSFEFERRGAQVTALDIETTADVDLPQVLKRLAAERGYADPLRDGFELAHRSLNSAVTRIVGTAYDLDPQRLGLFDLVHCGDLLLHLREPTRALEQIRSVTAGVALISDVFDPELGWPQRRESGLSRYQGGWVSAGWWTPALGTLVQMVADAGFSEVEVLKVYSLVPRWTAEGPWRAIVRARP